MIESFIFNACLIGSCRLQVAGGEIRLTGAPLQVGAVTNFPKDTYMVRPVQYD